ncbi:hypothetical protein [Streptomyces sp. NPDC002599]
MAESIQDPDGHGDPQDVSTPAEQLPAMPGGGLPEPATLTGAVASVWSNIFTTAYQRLREGRRPGQ